MEEKGTVSTAAAEEIESSSSGREGIVDDPSRYDYTQWAEKGNVGTAYHNVIEPEVLKSLPPGSAYSENTIQAFLKSKGVDPKFIPDKSSGIDLYIIDRNRGVVTPVDITNVAGAKGHVNKLNTDIVKMGDAFEKAGLHMNEPIEIEYVGRTFKDAAESIISELQALAT